MITVQTEVKLVIEYPSRYYDREKYLKDQEYELKNLKAELRDRRYTDGFNVYMEGTYVFQCETCEHENETRDLVYKCSVCGKEVCDSCCYTVGEKALCDGCWEIRDAAEDALDQVNSS